MNDTDQDYAIACLKILFSTLILAIDPTSSGTITQGLRNWLDGHRCGSLSSLPNSLAERCQQIFWRRNAQLLQQELELEAELLEENPELGEAIHHLNLQDILAQQQGLKGVMQGDSTPKSQNIWSKFFPGLGGS